MNKAFTLIEIIVVVVILGILTTFGVRQYTAAREQAVTKEAKANLKLMAAAEKIYRMESDAQTFVNCTCLCDGAGTDCCDASDGCNTRLRLSLNTKNWKYSVNGADDDEFYAAAGRNGGSGTYSSCVYTINHASVDVAVYSGTCPD